MASAAGFSVSFTHPPPPLPFPVPPLLSPPVPLLYYLSKLSSSLVLSGLREKA